MWRWCWTASRCACRRSPPPRALGHSPDELALYGGEDYALLVAAPAALLCVRVALRARADLDARGWTRLLIACVGLHLLTGAALAAGLLLAVWL